MQTRLEKQMVARGSGHLFSSKSLFTIILPLFIEQLLAITIGMCDTVMVGVNGEAAVSAISLIDNMSNLFIQLFAAFATGGAVIISQLRGKGNDEKASLAAKNLVYITLVASFILVAVLFPFRRSVLSLFFTSLSPDVETAALDYFVPVLFSYPFLALFSAGTAISRSVGNTRRTMAISLLMNVVNICGNAFLIYIFNMSTKGAGIASLCSRIIGCGIIFALLLRKKETCSLSGLAHGPFSPYLVKRICHIAIPSGIESSLFQVGKLLTISLITGLGTSAIAANAVVTTINSYCNIGGGSVNLAAITIIGFAAGKGCMDEERYYTRVLLFLSFALTFIIALPMFLFAQRYVGFYHLNEASFLGTVHAVRLCLIMCTFLWPFSFTLPCTFKAVGDIRYLMIVSILSMWIVRIGMSYVFILVLGTGYKGMWYAMYLDWFVRSTFFAIHYRGKAWQKIHLI